MHTFQYQMLACIDELRLAPGITAPKDKHQVLLILAERLDFIGTTAEVHAVARAVIYAYHHIIGRVYSYALAARITAARMFSL